MSIIGGNCMSNAQRYILAILALSAQFAFAMPDKDEIKRVQPMVLELMSPHERNFDAKKETAKEVGDAAVGLAKKAEGEAAKYILLKGAIHYYALAREYDLAADTLESIRAAVKDFPDDEVASIASKALGRAGADEAQRLKAICRVALMRSGAVADVKTFRSALRKDPDDKAALRGLADAYVRLGDWKKALKAFSKLGVKAAAFELDPAANKDFDTLKAADFWWSCRAQEPAPYRAHAAMLYKAAMGEGLVKGLRMPLVEKRIAEAEALVGAVAAPVQYGIGQGMQFTAQMAGSTIKLEAVGTPDAVTLEYSLGKGGTYSAYTVGNTITLANAGDLVLFRAGSGGNSTIGKDDNNYYKFVMTGKFNLDGTGFKYLINQSGSISTMPSRYTFRGLFRNCTSLVGNLVIDFPMVNNSSPQKIFSATFRNTRIENVSFGSEFTISDVSAFGDTFYGDSALKKAVFNGLTKSNYSGFITTFVSCTALEEVDFPELNNVIGSGLNFFNTFRGCSNLKVVKMPKYGGTGGSNLNTWERAFEGCTKLELIDFSEATAIPNIVSSTFQDTNNSFKVVVPDSLYSTWITTGEWANISRHIIKKSDWDALQNN